jgi:hypothetical protein
VKKFDTRFRLGFLLGIFPVLALGQGFTASVLGTVTDSAGAIIPLAIVTATNTGTGATTRVTTDGSGNYTVPQLQPGEYQVSAEFAGFKRAVKDKVTLDVDQRQLLDFRLELGQTSDAVNVSVEAEGLEAETATVGAVVSNAQTSELPLNGRNFLQLNQLAPGTQPQVKGSNLSSQGGGMEVHGLPETANNFWLNGVDNSTITIGQYVVNIPVYSIQEFRVMSPTYDSEFGRQPGAQINLITRSGGNSYHGDTYLFIRNSVFDAKNYFDPAGTIPAFRRGQYGGDFGGRLIRDKLFFFGAFEGLTFAQGQSAKNIVPTHQETLGDFSDQNTIIKDPTNNTPFAGNIIPQQRLNQTGLAYAAMFPAPNSGTNTLLVSPTSTQSDNVSLAKGDWVITNKDRLALQWALEDLNYHQPIASHGSTTNIPGFGQDQRGAHDIVAGLSETHVFTPNLISEFRLGWNRYEFQYYAQASTQDWCSVLGIQGCDEGAINWNVPAVSFNSVYSALGNSSGEVQFGTFDTTFIDPTVTWIKGRNTFKFGWDYHHYDTNSTNSPGPRGSFTFRGNWTGNPLADMLLGLPYQASKTVIADQPNIDLYYGDINQTAGFAQDDIRVSSRLTLNLGVRYELPFPGTETRDHAANLDLSNGVANAVLKISGQNGVGRELYQADYKEFAPRFGFAYTPRDKWVVRGGYGIFYQMVLENAIRTTHADPPFKGTYTIVGDGKKITINNALVSGLVANVPSFAAFTNYLKGGMIQEFSLGIQHELGAGFFLDLGYVGNRGRDINNTLTYNVPAPGPGAVQARRPNPNYAAISLVCPCTTSQYDGLEARLDKRLSRGMQFTVSYTYSRSFDNTGTSQDPANIAAQWGPSGYDTPQHLAVSYIYHLPFGSGLTYLSHMNRLGNAILGGWQLNGIYQYHSGLPFTAILASDNTNTQVNSDHPNVVGNPSQSTATCQTGTPLCWVNPAAFATPALYTFGNEGKNQLRGPTFRELDFAMAKSFPVLETRRIEFRAEAFNILNQVNFDTPSGTLSSTFGLISTAQPSRQLQLGARFVF